MTDQKCVLCGHGVFVKKQSLQKSELEELWLRSFNISVSRFFEESEIVEFVCERCELSQFYPDCPGDSEFYTDLARHEWYYLKKKWEYDKAIEDLSSAKTVLEVGGGSGEFLRQCSERLSLCLVMGLELSRSAVEASRKNGHIVESESIEEFSSKNENTFDAVCSFQVLEHVSNPRQFLESCVKCLTRGGKLLIAVPNCGGFVQWDRSNVLNLPPHHLTRWNQRSIQAIAVAMGLKLIRYRKEPLSDIHKEWFCTLLMDKFVPRRLRGTRAALVVRRMVLLLSGFRLVRAILPGHSIYASFEKC